MLKLNTVHLIPKEISLIGARNLGWDKWETEFFKWILKKCDVEEMLRRMGMVINFLNIVRDLVVLEGYFRLLSLVCTGAEIRLGLL